MVSIATTQYILQILFSNFNAKIGVKKHCLMCYIH
jgi:hypothetical protein